MRWRLKNRIRYLLKHRTRFDLFQNENHDWLCRLVMPPIASERNRVEPSCPRTDLDAFVASIAGTQNIHQMTLEELIYTFLRWVGKPILLDDLVGIVAELQGVCDVPADYRQADNEDAGIGDLLPDPSVNIAHHVEMRFYLQELWNEIRELQVRQRTALLLNLRDAQDRDALILFTLTGIVKSSEIADLLGMTLEQFGEYWSRLPLDDCAIGELLGISRQQVINLRKSARTRLARRVAAKWESGKGSR